MEDDCANATGVNRTVFTNWGLLTDYFIEDDVDELSLEEN